MKTVLGVAAVMLLSAPVVNASKLKESDAPPLTTKGADVVPHALTVAYAPSVCRLPSNVMRGCKN
ncbi:hypothetical protein IRZ70_17495 [Pseudomonas monteilii]|nr:hypothetical protein [Pseudomonas monteilii]